MRACRPRQWLKNVLVCAAPAAAGILMRADVVGKLALTFVAFCALSSATYLLNDVHDREEDARSARRRMRPVASGELPVAVAVVAAVALVLGGLALAAAVRPAVAGVGLGYVALTGSYTLWWREVAIADIAAIAGGFVLRALAGGVATSITVSRWFLLVTSFGALFVVAGKRYAELRESEVGSESEVRSESAGGAGGGGGGGGGVSSAGASGRGVVVRASLRAYSERYLRFVIGLAATVTTTAYCLWAFQRSHHDKLSWYELTLVPFVLWLLRYALLLDRGEGHSPERLVFEDRFLLSMSVAWIAVFVCGVYVAG